MAANLLCGSVCSNRARINGTDRMSQRQMLAIDSSFVRNSQIRWTPSSTPHQARYLKLRLAPRALPGGKSKNNNSPPPQAPPSTPLVISKTGEALLRVYMPIAVVLGLLMLIDAAYSGDWSRIGVLTKEQEIFLQGVVPIAAAGHAGCALLAAVLSARRGEKSWPLRGAKVLASGFVGVLEVALLPEEP